MSGIVGDVAVRVGADITVLKQEMATGADRVKDFSVKSAKHLRSVASSMVKAGAAASGAAAIGLVALTKQATTTGRELQNLIRLSNASASEFQKMAFGAGALGVENEKLADILKDVNDRVGDFIQTGGGPMADFFENIAPKVGVTAQQFAKLSGPQALQLFYTSLEKANLSQADMTFYLEAMASDLTLLQPLLRNNGKLLQEQSVRAERLGIVLSEIEIQQLEHGAQSFYEMGETAKMAGTLIGANLIPYIDVLLERFGGAVEGVGGFRNIVEASVNTSLRGFSKVANVIHGVNVAAKGATVGFQSLGSGILGVVSLVIDGWARVFSQMTAGIWHLLDTANRIPGIDIPTDGLSRFSNELLATAENQARFRDEMIESVKQSAKEFHDLAMQELPSDNVERFLADVAKEFENRAAEVVKHKAAIFGAGDADMVGQTRTDAEGIEAIRNRFKSETTLLNEKLLMEQELLAAALQSKMLTEQEHYDLTEQLLWEHEQTLTGIEAEAAAKREAIVKAEAAAKRQALGDALSNMSTLMNSESRKMFEVGKAAALANATISAYEAITSSYAVGSRIGGPPVGAAFAAAAGLAQFQTLNSIRKQSFGSGTSARSATEQINGAGTPVNSAPQGGGQQQERVIRVEGLNPSSLFSGEQMVQTLEQVWKDGGGSGRLLFA